MPKRIRNLTLAFVAGGAVALAASVYGSYRDDIRLARIRVSTGSQVIDTACGLVEYSDIGRGLPILVIHGAGGGFDQGEDFARAFLGEGFRVIVPSRFGYLRTPLAADASPKAQADAHACLLDRLGLQRVGVVGGSGGAPSAMQLCLRYPDRCSAMVLLFPMVYGPALEGERPPQPSALTDFLLDTLTSDFMFWLATKAARDTMIETILGTPAPDFRRANREEQERVLQTLRHVLPIGGRLSGLRNERVVDFSLPRYELERYTIPTLVVSAENDLFGTYRPGRYTADHIAGARFIGYPRGGHLLVGHRREVEAEVTGFLRAAKP